MSVTSWQRTQIRRIGRLRVPVAVVEHEHEMLPDAGDRAVLGQCARAAVGHAVANVLASLIKRHGCLPGSMRMPVTCGAGRLPRRFRFSFARSLRARLYSARNATPAAGGGLRGHDATCS